MPASESVKKLFKTQIAATGPQVNCLVYDLYGLTDAEIAFVEKKQ